MLKNLNVELWQQNGDKSQNFTGYKFYMMTCFSKFPDPIKIGKHEHEREVFIKVGVTYRDLHERFKDIPYHWVAHELRINPSIAQPIWDLEKHILDKFKPYRYRPILAFSGASEILNNNKFWEILDEIRYYCELNGDDGLISTDINQLKTNNAKKQKTRWNTDGVKEIKQEYWAYLQSLNLKKYGYLGF